MKVDDAEFTKAYYEWLTERGEWPRKFSGMQESLGFHHFRKQEFIKHLKEKGVNVEEK